MAEENELPITRWISQARLGDEEAFSKLFDFYISRLQTYISPKLTSRDRHEGYEEDMAIESMQKLWEDLNESRFEAVVHREDLWNAMICIAQSKSIDRRRYHRSKKRLRVVLNQMEFATECDPSYKLPSSEWEFLEEWALFVVSLPDDRYREIVRLKMEGTGVFEIAMQLGTTTRTVNRKLEMAKDCWKTFCHR